MSMWAEIRQLHAVGGVAKREIARRFGVDVKTVRRALARTAPPPTARPSPERGCVLDPWRERIEAWLLEDPKITAKRIATLVRDGGVSLTGRAVRRFVARVRARLFARPGFVHRTSRPGESSEVDFGESWAEVDGVRHKVKYLVVTLPWSNVYFAKAYPAERIECLLDGMASAFTWFGGVPGRSVLDNTSLAVTRVMTGRDREETAAFHAFRGGYALDAQFCAPAKGWEKGSVEGGVGYVRDNAFRPMPAVKSFEELNARILFELDRDMDLRRLPDGRTVRQALHAEREHLRPLPTPLPETCRRLSRVVDKFGHVLVDRVHYSVPIENAYRPAWAKAFHDRVEIAVHDAVVAVHRRDWDKSAFVLDARHVLSLLEKKSRAATESTAIRQWPLAPCFDALRRALAPLTRNADRE